MQDSSDGICTPQIAIVSSGVIFPDRVIADPLFLHLITKTEGVAAACSKLFQVLPTNESRCFMIRRL